MNKTKVTTRKGSKTKTKKESQEVFVLPPNLLEKLGINLGNYGSSTGSTTNSKITDINVSCKDNGLREKNVSLKNNVETHISTSANSSSEIESSSIIETAELMKKSVFLSPTFITNNTSVIQGEIEIVGNIEPESIEVNAGHINNEYIFENAEEVSTDLQREYESISNPQKSMTSPNSSSIQENEHCGQIVNRNVEIHDFEMQTLIDDHADEAYSSDCSSSNTGCTDKPNINKCNENKIHIISEQIIFPSQFFKSKSSPKNSSLIHVPINTMIKSQTKNSFQQDDSTLDLIPIITGNIKPAEIAVVNEYDKYEQNFIKQDDISIEDIEMVHNINNIDLCAVLNVNESEFIIATQNHTGSREDHEAIHKQEVIIEDEAIDMAAVVPCNIGDVGENNCIMIQRENFNADRNIYSEHDDNALKDPFEVKSIASNNEKGVDCISTKSISNEDNSVVSTDKNIEILRSDETEIEIQNSLGDQYSQIKARLQTVGAPANSDTYQEALASKKESSTEEINVELHSTLQNGQVDLTNCDYNVTISSNEPISLSKSSQNVPKSSTFRRRSNSIRKNPNENKIISPTRSLQISQCEQDIKNTVKENSTKKEIVYFKPYKKQVCEEQDEQKDIHRKNNDNGSKKTNEVKVNQMNNATNYEDKIREIAKYLSEFADLKKRNHFTDSNQRVTSKTMGNKKSTTYSKSSIQGVEKPGGSEINKNQNYPPTKTYERKGRQERKTIPSYTFNKPNASTQSIDMTDSSTTNICDEMEVCLCHDFGRLMSYDSLDSYEHIHFWNNSRADCTLDVILSIYSEDASPVPVDNFIIGNDVKDYPTEVSDVTPFKICWNEIKHISENELYNKETDETVLSKQHIGNVNKNKDDENQEAKKKHVVENTMITVNDLQNYEGIPNDKTTLNDSSAKTRQKRKLSTIPVDNGEPPAKNKKQGTSKQNQNKNQPSSTNAGKNVSVTAPKDPSSSQCDSASLFATGQHQDGTGIPVNETTTKQLDLPSTSVNDAKPPERRPNTRLSTENKTKTIICGVCQLHVEGDWIEHIASKHDYLAWKSGEPSLNVDDDGAVREHLNEITKARGGLTCGKCGITRKSVKAYFSHVRRCTEVKADCSSEARSGEEQPNVRKEESLVKGCVKCGVCGESMPDTEWTDHIASRHDYLAWKHGGIPLDVRDETAVKEHLYEITKACGGLTCAKCGLTRKYVKAYLSHVRSCTGLSDSQNDTAYNFSSEVIPKVESGPISEMINETIADTNTGPVKCGACEEYVQLEDWNHHIASRHDYLAWKYGQTPLDVNDEEAVRNHLYEISKACGGLTCAKCGLTRKYVKAYLSHIKSCNGLNESQNDSTYNISTDEAKPTNKSSDTEITAKEAIMNITLVKCAVCEESLQEKDWNSHIASQHDYLAWKVGDKVLDVQNDTTVIDHLSEIAKASGGLTCARCGLTRKHVRAYLGHIKTCHVAHKSQNDSNISTEIRHRKASVDRNNDSITNISKQENAPTIGPPVKCGICSEMVQEEEWYSHIGSRHDYLAWRSGETALDIHDEAAVKDHLYAITNACGGLTCSKCGLTRKYVKSYQTHFKSCEGINDSQNISTYNTSTAESRLVDFANSSASNDKEHELVKCGVCSEDVHETEWNSHIASRHEYLAWKNGEETLDVTDEDAVRHHLVRIRKEIGRLKCAKCCKNIQTAKKYMFHVKSCERVLSSNDLKISSVKQECQVQALIEQPAAPADGPALEKCGVCGQYTTNEDWLQHIATSHGYLAWKDGDPPLNVNDEQEVRVHLRNIIIQNGILTCQKCDLPRKSVKSYVHHLNICEDLQEEKNNENDPKELKIKEETHSFKCGVCSEVVISVHWAQHLSEKHDYLAWKDGDTPVNEDDEEEVHQHLFNYTKQFGCLHCKYCGKNRKYVKSYLEHIKFCKDGGVRPIDRPTAAVDFDDSDVDFASGGTCAVCHEEVEPGKWIQHTQKQHNYLAWRKGETPWNVEDYEDLNQYLYVICKRMDGLTCNKCGLVRKYVKTYLTHIKNCDVAAFDLDLSVAEGVGPSNKDEHQCAMCKEIVKSKDWKTHAMEKHYNVTWIVGETPIDIKNVYAVERFLKEYKQVMGTLKCNACGLTRASFAGFYAHIIICKKTEEEIDMYRSVCEICNNKYLCIYKNQHAMIHKVQMLTAEAKVKNAEEKDVIITGKRRAAVKARSVIENYSDNMSKHLHSCKSCGFGTDFKAELKTHKCEVSNERDFSADEDSAAEIESSDGESGDTDVDSNISNEVNDGEVDDDEEEVDEHQAKKKRYKEPAPVVSKVTRIPFKVEDVNSYIRQGDVDFCNTFLTDEVLFRQWQCQHEPVRESELTRYLPPLEHSCKLKSDSDWTTLKRFEAIQDDNGTSIFVGASIVCIAWVPPRVRDISDGVSNFLAIACHNGPDCPRYQGGETPKHENLIQIWDFNKFGELPELVLGIAHDYGTVWSMDWCPSGARDALSDEDAIRLGLLAVACSSGSVYIFSVPYPSSIVKDNQIVQKLKPVAELRMTMGSERKSYQATSVSWSKQKEHKLILVGYADGSTAYYDLHTDSPLLSTVVNNVQVFYPYYDERPHNTCITGTDLYPVSGDAAGSGCGAWTAPTGAELAPRAGTGVPGRARLAAASHGVSFAPQACSAVLAGDDAIMQAAVSELVWVPPGRRIGGTHRAAGCARCGRVASSMPPTLRIMRLHPSYCDAKKQVIGMLEMTHLAKKRKKKVNDELSMIIEPLTYEDAVRKYGIEFKRVGRTDRVLQQQCSAKPKAHCPERFPLADVESMAFCPSKRFHDRLAVATHSGILFLITTN